MWEWKQELEDLGFHTPNRMPTIRSGTCWPRMPMSARPRNRYIQMLRDELTRVGVGDVTITGRTKQIFSIWRKMQSKDRSFDQIMGHPGDPGHHRGWLAPRPDSWRAAREPLSGGRSRDDVPVEAIVKGLEQ